MQYRSTRGLSGVSFSEVAVQGLAPDGGLYVPETLPQIDLPSLEGLSYPEVAAKVMAPFCDIDPLPLCQAAYGPDYGGPVAPLRPDPWGYVLELFHGPTYSFKDVALQFLGKLLDGILERRQTQLNLLVATSGDTGSAALHSVLGCSRLRCWVMFPRGMVSRLQEWQMTSLHGPNTACLEIDGSFDDCQAILKQLNRDPDFKQRHCLGAVNSVNWARLLAQSIYYVWSWLQVRQPLNVVVPTGNFGNVLSAWLAAQMGVPLGQLVVATNENDIVHRFLEGGTYAQGQVSQTLAPAMDIQVASNLERFLFLNGGGTRVKGWMEQFEQGQPLTPELATPLRSGRASNSQILEAIAAYHRQTGVVLCPHTAVGWWVAQQLQVPPPYLLVATAHPGKFPEAVSQALGRDYSGHPELLALESLHRPKVTLPADSLAVGQWMEGQRLCS